MQAFSVDPFQLKMGGGIAGAFCLCSPSELVPSNAHGRVPSNVSCVYSTNPTIFVRSSLWTWFGSRGLLLLRAALLDNFERASPRQAPWRVSWRCFPSAPPPWPRSSPRLPAWRGGTPGRPPPPPSTSPTRRSCAARRWRSSPKPLRRANRWRAPPRQPSWRTRPPKGIRPRRPRCERLARGHAHRSRDGYRANQACDVVLNGQAWNEACLFIAEAIVDQDSNTGLPHKRRAPIVPQESICAEGRGSAPGAVCAHRDNHKSELFDGRKQAYTSLDAYGRGALRAHDMPWAITCSTKESIWFRYL